MILGSGGPPCDSHTYAGKTLVLTLACKALVKEGWEMVAVSLQERVGSAGLVLDPQETS